MTTQNYFVVQNNTVTNTVVWDGGPDWTPPADATLLVEETTPALVWVPTIDAVTKKITAWTLTEQVGAGGIGFTWDGTVLTTNQPEPTIPTE